MINGIPRRLLVNPDDLLVDVLREQLQITSVKVGCGKGQCGACSVILDGKVIRACIVKMNRVDENAAVTTLEGVGTPSHLHPLQQSWIYHGAAQCGFCTPGFIVSAKALLDTNPSPSREDVRDWFQKHHNVCRCTGYKPLVDAVMAEGKPADARKVLERHLPLPGILARLCDHPCENACLRHDLGGSVAMHGLELACMLEVGAQSRPLPMPPKKFRMAVLGAGLAGLAAAWDLSRKAYPVTVYDPETPEETLAALHPRLGAAGGEGLAKNFLAEDMEMLARQKVKFERAVPDAALLEKLAAEYDAVLVDADALRESAPGLVPDAAAVDPATLLWRGNICCAGWRDRTPTGHLFASSSRQAGQGRQAAQTMERLTSGVSLTAARDKEQGQLHTDVTGIAPVPRVEPAARAGEAEGEPLYSMEEAAREAERCLQCQCMICVRECAYLQKYKGYPRLYARQIHNNASIVKGLHTANAVINGCALCGQCEELCPENFSMLRRAQSLCPVCLRRVDAVYDRCPDDEHCVELRKTCPDHGTFAVPVWREAAPGDPPTPPFSAWSRPKSPSYPANPRTPIAAGCPFDCGLCPAHAQHTCTGLFEVTMRCDMACPVCYADAGDHARHAPTAEGGGAAPAARPEGASDISADIPLEVVAAQMDALKQASGPCNVQISGGEPTVRDDLPRIIGMARQRGFGLVQINTNGLRLSREAGYARTLREAGLDSVYLQWDAASEKGFRPLRGRDCLDFKRHAVRHCAEAGLGVVLVATLVRGVNDGEVGDLLRLALELGPAVRGLHMPQLRGGLRAVICSDLDRCRETAALLLEGLLENAPRRGGEEAEIPPLFVEPGLREICLGRWQGMVKL